MRLLWLGEEPSHDPALVGGKAAQLSRLAARFDVPPGFSVPAPVFEAALAAGLTIQDEEDAPTLPPDLIDALAAAYATLAERTGQAQPKVAVRSSAIDEDGAAASFAGQHETFLNVAGIDAIAHAIARCWASVRSALRAFPDAV